MSKLKVIEFGKGAVREVDLPDAPYRPLVNETPEQEEIRELRDRVAGQRLIINLQSQLAERNQAQLAAADQWSRLLSALLLVESFWIAVALIARWL